jgi:hypothetical protein
MVVQPIRWFADEPDLSPWLKALEDVRRRAAREGWCYQRVQAIIVSIDQYAEAALGKREFFLNKLHSIGGSRKRPEPDISLGQPRSKGPSVAALNAWG